MVIHIILQLSYDTISDVSDLELSSYPLNEEAPAVVSTIYEPQSSELHTDGCHNHVHFFIAEKVWNIPYKNNAGYIILPICTMRRLFFLLLMTFNTFE